MSQVIVVERRFAGAPELSALGEKERRVEWCLEQHGVTPLRAYMAHDGTSAMCLYRAPDAEAVRATQRVAGLPVERVWPAHVVDGSSSAHERLLVCERSFDEPVTLAQVADALATRGHCMQQYRVELVATHLSLDGRRMICVFAAPDAEAVRSISRGLDLPIDRIWAGFTAG